MGNGAVCCRKERSFFLNDHYAAHSEGLQFTARLRRLSWSRQDQAAALTGDFEAANNIKIKMETALCFGSLNVHDKCRTSICVPPKKKENNVKLPLLCTCFVLSGGGLGSQRVWAFLCNPKVLLLLVEISIASPSRGFLQKLLALQNAFLTPPVPQCTMTPIKM